MEVEGGISTAKCFSFSEESFLYILDGEATEANRNENGKANFFSNGCLKKGWQTVANGDRILCLVYI